MKKIISILLLAVPSLVLAANEGYLTDTNGQIVRSGTGLCWHTGYWTPANAVESCDPVTKALPVSSKVTLSADTLFDFNKSTLKPEGKAVLDNIASQTKVLNIDVVAVTGYTDRIGDDRYNLTLSTKRANAVKTYLLSKGVSADHIVTQGKGKANPVTGTTCKGAVTNKLIACLQPDRRAVIEIIGTK